MTMITKIGQRIVAPNYAAFLEIRALYFPSIPISDWKESHEATLPNYQPLKGN